MGSGAEDLWGDSQAVEGDGLSHPWDRCTIAGEGMPPAAKERHPLGNQYNW